MRRYNAAMFIENKVITIDWYIYIYGNYDRRDLCRRVHSNPHSH